MALRDWAPRANAYVTFLREPRARLRSAYAYRRHHCDGCNASTTLAQFATSPLNRGVYANMLAGTWDALHGARETTYPDAARVAVAVDRLRNFAVVGLLERWAASVCLLRAKTSGGHVLRNELANVRPGTDPAPAAADDDYAADWADEAVYAAARGIFEADLAAYFGAGVD